MVSLFFKGGNSIGLQKVTSYCKSGCVSTLDFIHQKVKLHAVCSRSVYFQYRIYHGTVINRFIANLWSYSFILFLHAPGLTVGPLRLHWKIHAVNSLVHRSQNTWPCIYCMYMCDSFPVHLETHNCYVITSLKMLYFEQEKWRILYKVWTGPWTFVPPSSASLPKRAGYFFAAWIQLGKFNLIV